MADYKIRYGVLPSGSISDKVLVKNPNYGERIGKYGSRPVKRPKSALEQLEYGQGFLDKLEASVLSEGFRNPIFCNSIEEGTFCRYGTTRLWVAKMHKLDIPCIIADYTDRWDDLEELFTEQDIKNKYPDTPDIIELQDDEMRIDCCPHYHLKDK